MSDEAALKLTFRLAPADDKPADPQVFDDIIRLVRQAIATAPNQTPIVIVPTEGFHEPEGEDKQRIRSLETKIKHRIEQASAASHAAVAKRLESGDQPDKSLEASQQVVAAVQRAMLRRVAVHVTESPT